MSLEHALTRFEAAVVPFSDKPANVAVLPDAWWSLTQIVLAGFFATYVVGVVQDFQRIRELRAEPPPLAKIIVITKNEAWQRIHSRAARPQGWDLSARLALRRLSHP
jgi:hypothetical protein